MRSLTSFTLLADSGGTKTLWTLINADGTIVFNHKAEGINPLLLDDDEITRRLTDVQQMTMQLMQPADTLAGINIFFYGSGVTVSQQTRMEQLLRDCFAATHTDIHAHSDMLAAARALCQDKEGIACILGTGSNSCRYDGKNIVEQTPSLGFILGDEGGAVHMGKLLLNTIYKGLCDKSIKVAFEEETGENLQSVIEKIYRQPMPNTFIASLTHFIHNHIEEYPVLADIVTNSFKAFIHHNILPYHCSSLPIHALGGIAWAFQQQWREALRSVNFQPGTIAQSPTEGLLRFHT